MSVNYWYLLNGIPLPGESAGAAAAPKAEVAPEVKAARVAVGEQVNALRTLKADGASADTIAAAEAQLTKLKNELAALTGEPIKEAQPKAAKKPAAAKKEAAGAKKDAKKEGTKLGVDVTKAEDFSDWYSQTITKSEMLDYYDISGCYILRPWAYKMWEALQEFMDGEFKKLGVENAYFPCFVSGAALKKEESHIAGFAPEVAWVTKSGQSELAEPIALRPTSETVMYPSFAKWIQSHRDLPLKLNQWCNVVRWEFKHPTPFIRTREFLWQEGHTAHATKEEAAVEVIQILDIYARVYEECMALPVVKGQKTENEKFAGGLYTTSVEVFIPSVGRGLQGATSHCLGQNFARMFDIEIEDKASPSGKSHVWQNSWGCTTRTLGALVMVHGDDKGLVLPPRIAPLQAVIVPIWFNEQKDDVKAYGETVLKALQKINVRAKLDDRENYNPGWKFNHWELKGVPIRVETGPKDITAQAVTVVVRHNGEKLTIPLAELATAIPALLNNIQTAMLAKATAERDACVVQVRKWKDFVPTLDQKKACLVPWCREAACEDDIKARSGQAAQSAVEDTEEAQKAPSAAAKSLNIPFDQPALSGEACIGCSKPAVIWALFGRSY